MTLFTYYKNVSAGKENIPKTERTIARDKSCNEIPGWMVLRFWENEIKKDFEACVQRILSHGAITP